jgi:hypothetical protein
MTATVSKTFSVGGLTFSEQKSVANKGVVSREETIPAAKTGTLTTRTSDSVGEITGQADHGVLTGDIIDIYWTAGGALLSRRGITVGTVAALAIPITDGAGDVLPADETALTLMKRQTFDLKFDGSDLVALFAYSAAAQTTIVLSGDDGVEDHPILMSTAGQTYDWTSGNGVTNPVIGDAITQVHITQGDSTGTKSVTVAAAYN